MKEFFFTCLMILVLISISNAQKYRQLGNAKSLVYDIEILGSDNRVALAEGAEINIYNYDTGVKTKSLKGHSDVILALDAIDSNILVSAGRDRDILLWNVETEEVMMRLDYHNSVVTTVAVSDDGKWIVSGDAENTIYIYNLSSKQLHGQYFNHTDDILDVELHPDGNHIFSSSLDGTVGLKNLYNGEFRLLSSFKTPVRDLALDDEATKLVACTDQSNSYIYNISDLSEIKKFNNTEYKSGWLLSAGMYSDGSAIVTGAVSGKVTISFRFGKYGYKLKHPVVSAQFLPAPGDKLVVIVGTLGGGAKIIEAANMNVKYKSGI